MIEGGSNGPNLPTVTCDCGSAVVSGGADASRCHLKRLVQADQAPPPRPPPHLINALRDPRLPRQTPSSSIPFVRLSPKR
eukprot:1195913-Prorocentrum_minimum.AAC.10